MTISVKVSVSSNQPGPANFQVERQLGSGKDAFWQAGEIGTIRPGEEREFPVYPQQRIVLSE